MPLATFGELELSHPDGAHDQHDGGTEDGRGEQTDGQRHVAVPAQERHVDPLGVLRDEDDEQHDEDDPDGHRRPRRLGPTSGTVLDRA